MKNGFIQNILNFFLLRSLRSKIIFAFTMFSVVILFFMNLTVTSTITKLEEDLIASRLVSDINYIEDLISGNSKTSRWNIQNDAIYFGDVLIGDGTEETANFEPFLEHERKTGTFAYVFMLDHDAELGYVEATENSEGYEEGHYLRIAGSTKSPEGKSIVGTYISKNVSDALDQRGMYSGEANVAGGLIYCLYKELLDENGNIIGAIVVGRNITELKSQIASSVNHITLIMVGIVIFACLLITFFVSKWVSAIASITAYLQEIQNGVIPEKPLHLNSKDEMALISESVNKMVHSIKENNVLRKKSETDALTGLPNRFAYDYYAKYIYNKMLLHPQTLAVEILDIDFFKEYNDNYGHHAGDKCIKKIAKEIQLLSSADENIFCCRYGGDEFIIIYSGFTRDEIKSFLKILKDRIMACAIKHEYSKVDNIVTITQGVCFSDFDPRYTIEDYFNQADKALYEVKKVARNHYDIVSI